MQLIRLIRGRLWGKPPKKVVPLVEGRGEGDGLFAYQIIPIWCEARRCAFLSNLYIIFSYRLFQGYSHGRFASADSRTASTRPEQILSWSSGLAGHQPDPLFRRDR